MTITLIRERVGARKNGCAIDTGFPIVPVAMKNTDYAMGKRQNSVNRAVCEMVLLAPIETKNLTSERDLPHLLIKMRGAIAEEPAAKTESRILKLYLNSSAFRFFLLF
jgi:hypothetical protein